MKRYGILSVFLLIIWCGLISLTGCDNAPEAAAHKISAPEDLNHSGMVIGVPQGAAAMTAAEEFFDQATIKYYGSLADGYAAVQQKKIAAFVFDRPSLTYLAAHNDKLILLPGKIADVQIAIGAAKNQQSLISEVNKFIAQCRKDGTDQKMYARWFAREVPPMPEIPTAAHPKRVLHVGTEGLNEPMNFFGTNNVLTGYDVEFARRLALYLNAELKISTMNFEALLIAAANGKIDLLIANLNATPERRESLLMSDNYIESSIGVIVHRDNYAEPVAAAPGIRSVYDLPGKKVAYLNGSIFQEVTEKKVKDVQFLSFNDNNSVAQAVRYGKADAAMFDEPIARLYCALFPELYIAEIFEKDNYGFACRKNSPLTARASRVIRELWASGELKKLKERWLGADDTKKHIPKWTHRNFTGKNGVLRFATDPMQMPMSYMGAKGEMRGLDIELACRIAYELDMKIEIVTMNFAGLIEALNSGKVDMVGASMSITEERKEKVDFAECYYHGGMTILTKRPKLSGKRVVRLAQLYGQKIGVLTGTTADKLAQKHFPSSEAVYFSSFADMPLALEQGKITAFLMEEPQSRLLFKEQPNLMRLPKKISSEDYAFLFAKNRGTLRDDFNRELQNLKNSGTLQKLEHKWFADFDNATISVPVAKPTKGTLKLATVPQAEPFSFLRNNQAVGYEIEIAQLIAAKLGYALEPVFTEWGSCVEAVNSGKADLAGGCISVTPERQIKVNFSAPTYRGGMVVVVKKASTAAPKFDFGAFCRRASAELAASFERTFIREQRWKLIAEGLGVTVLITILSAIVGTILAAGVCAMRRAHNAVVSRCAKIYIALMQGTPILVILMILYYIIFARIDINAIVVAVIGFALNFAAYAGEMFRSGIEGIPKGQREAALALGFSKFAAFRKVILPQVLRRTLPVYKGEFVSMLKMTSIVGYIAIQDLTKMSDIIRSRTYEAFFPLIITAVIYFVAAHLLAAVLTYLEFRLDPLQRRRAGKGVKF